MRRQYTSTPSWVTHYRHMRHRRQVTWGDCFEEGPGILDSLLIDMLEKLDVSIVRDGQRIFSPRETHSFPPAIVIPLEPRSELDTLAKELGYQRPAPNRSRPDSGPSWLGLQTVKSPSDNMRR